MSSCEDDDRIGSANKIMSRDASQEITFPGQPSRKVRRGEGGLNILGRALRVPDLGCPAPFDPCVGFRGWGADDLALKVEEAPLAVHHLFCLDMPDMVSF